MAKFNKRVIHLYLSCFFAPMLMFFILSGSMQMLGLQEKNKTTGYNPPQIVTQIARAHMQQRISKPIDKEHPPKLFRVFTFAMAAGFALTMPLGVQIALENRARSKAAVLCLVAGTVIPLVILIINRF